MFVVAYPGNDMIVVVRLSKEAIQGEHMFLRYMDRILLLRVGETMVINNKYLIVRVG